jgi:hypothetical protein
VANVVANDVAIAPQAFRPSGFSPSWRYKKRDSQVTLNMDLLLSRGDHQMGLYFIKGVSWKGTEMIGLLLRQALIQSCANERLKRFRGDSFFGKRASRDRRECLFEKRASFECDQSPVRKGSHGIKSLSGSKKENRINFIQEG